jgi:hypothetical protein
MAHGREEGGRHSIGIVFPGQNGIEESELEFADDVG